MYVIIFFLSRQLKMEQQALNWILNLLRTVFPS